MAGTTDRDVLVTDVVMRDGLQDEAVVLPPGDRIRLGRMLLGAGLGALEVGSFVNPAKVPQMEGSGTVLAALRAGVADAGADGPDLHTLVFTEGGARRAIVAGAASVRLVVSASDGHSTANAGVPTAAALDRLQAAADVLLDAGVRIEGCVATAFVCPFDGPTDPARTAATARRLAELGAGVVHLADTIGAAHPGAVAAGIAAVRAELGADIELGLHLHDTYGMAPASALRALDLGIRRFDAALGGLGGCPFAPGASGNVATDDLVHLLHREGMRTGIDGDRLVAARDEVARLVGHPLSSALATVGVAPAAHATPSRV